jgi:hypothetical protein
MSGDSTTEFELVDVLVDLINEHTDAEADVPSENDGGDYPCADVRFPNGQRFRLHISER